MASPSCWTSASPACWTTAAADADLTTLTDAPDAGPRGARVDHRRPHRRGGRRVALGCCCTSCAAGSCRSRARASRHAIEHARCRTTNRWWPVGAGCVSPGARRPGAPGPGRLHGCVRVAGDLEAIVPPCAGPGQPLRQRRLMMMTCRPGWATARWRAARRLAPPYTQAAPRRPGGGRHGRGGAELERLAWLPPSGSGVAPRHRRGRATRSPPYLTELLASANPQRHRGNWPTVLQLLTAVAPRWSSSATTLTTRLRLLQGFVDTYHALNRFDGAKRCATSRSR